MASPRSPIAPMEGGLAPLLDATEASSASATGSPSKKPAWKRPISNGINESAPSAAVNGPFVAADESWPALSEATAAAVSTKTSPKPSPSPPGPMVAAPPMKAALSNLNPNTSQTHAFPARPRSMKREGNGMAPLAASSSSAPSLVQIDMDKVQPTVLTPDGTAPSKPSVEQHPVLRLDGNRGGGDNRQGYGRNGRRGSSNNGGGNDRYLVGRSGGGSGGRRNQEHGAGFERHSRGAHQHQWSPRGSSIRGQAPPPPPPLQFIAPSPQAPPFLNHMPYPAEMSHVFYYGMPPPPPPEAMRSMHFVPHPPAPPAILVPRPMDPHRVALLMQIEYYFSSENLCKDTYLRRHMDEQGWVSIPLIAGFNRVKQLLVDSLLQVAPDQEQADGVRFIIETMQWSSVLEVEGDKIRRRHDWMNWLINSPRVTSMPSSPAAYDINAMSTNLQNVRLEGPGNEMNAHVAIHGPPPSTAATSSYLHDMAPPNLNGTGFPHGRPARTLSRSDTL